MIKPIGPDMLKTIMTAHGGPARLNRYRVIMPTFYIGGDAITLDVLCRSASLPGRTLNTAVKRTNMKEIQVPTGYTNSQVDLIFTETTDFTVSRYLDEWLARCVDPETYQVQYRDEIVRDIIVMSTDASGIPQYIVHLKNAYPKTKTQIDMSDNGEDAVVEVRAAFEYEDYEVINSPLISGVQDGIRMLKSGNFKLPTNLLREISVEDIGSRIREGTGGLF